MVVSPRTDAVTAEAISGESAANATINPSIASERCQRPANLSRRVTSAKLAPSALAVASTNATVEATVASPLKTRTPRNAV
jgi:hypothetical protein